MQAVVVVRVLVQPAWLRAGLAGGRTSFQKRVMPSGYYIDSHGVVPAIGGFAKRHIDHRPHFPDNRKLNDNYLSRPRQPGGPSPPGCEAAVVR